MIVYELEQQIDEAVSMVHDGKRLKRKKCYFVSEKQYRRLTAQEQAAAMAKEQLFDSQMWIWMPTLWRVGQNSIRGTGLCGWIKTRHRPRCWCRSSTDRTQCAPSGIPGSVGAA